VHRPPTTTLILLPHLSNGKQTYVWHGAWGFQGRENPTTLKKEKGKKFKALVIPILIGLNRDNTFSLSKKSADATPFIEGTWGQLGGTYEGKILAFLYTIERKGRESPVLLTGWT
jgi:hypothetical protein